MKNNISAEFFIEKLLKLYKVSNVAEGSVKNSVSESDNS